MQILEILGLKLFGLLISPFSESTSFSSHFSWGYQLHGMATMMAT
jgi:hypothetical protein